MQAAPVTTYPLPANIQVTVLFHFLAKIESEGLRLANSGFRREQIDALRYLPTSDFIQLFNENRPLVHAWGDAANLDFALKRLSDSRAETELQTEFIRRGASAAMMFQPKILCYPVSTLQKASNTPTGDGFFGFDANIFSIM